MNREKFNSLKGMSSLFLNAENYWKNEFSITNGCCGDNRMHVDEEENQLQLKKDETIYTNSKINEKPLNITRH